MYIEGNSDSHNGDVRKSRGNAWSGVVALALLAMFTVALVASEADSLEAEKSGKAGIVIAGQ